MNPAHTDTLRDKLSQPTLGEDNAKATTKLDKHDIRRIRSQCHNGLHFCVCTLSDPERHQIMSGMVEVLAPTSAWHSIQSETLRSFGDCERWYTRIAIGDGLAPMNEMIASFRGGRISEQARLHWHGACPDGSAWSGLSVAHPLVAKEDSVANYMGNLVTSCLKLFLRSMLWHTHGWPGRFAALLDEARRPAVLADMKTDWEVWRLVRQRPGPTWKAFMKRSCFNLMVVQKVFRVAARCGFADHPDLIDVVRGMFRSLGQSNVIELGVNVSKKEAEKSYTKRVRNHRRWMGLIDSSVLGGWFKYREMDRESEQVPRGQLNAKSEPSFFSGTEREASMAFRGVVGGTASWHTIAPRGDIAFVNDIIMSRELAGSGKWEQISAMWLACLMPDNNSLVRDAGAGGAQSKQCFWCLGEAGVSGKIGWLADEVRIKGVRFFTLRADVGLTVVRFRRRKNPRPRALALPAPGSLIEPPSWASSARNARPS